jgi:hypothetical protein
MHARGVRSSRLQTQRELISLVLRMRNFLRTLNAPTSTLDAGTYVLKGKIWDAILRYDRHD